MTSKSTSNLSEHIKHSPSSKDILDKSTNETISTEQTPVTNQIGEQLPSECENCKIWALQFKEFKSEILREFREVREENKELKTTVSKLVEDNKELKTTVSKLVKYHDTTKDMIALQTINSIVKLEKHIKNPGLRSKVIYNKITRNKECHIIEDNDIDGLVSLIQHIIDNKDRFGKNLEFTVRDMNELCSILLKFKRDNNLPDIPSEESKLKIEKYMSLETPC